MKNPNICKNCNSPNINNYCCECGQKVYKNRFTIKSYFASLLAAFNLEKGIFFTVKMLFIRPGTVVNEYIQGKTKSYFNPLNYILVVGGIYAFLILWLNIFDTGLDAVSGIYENGAVQNSSEEVAQLQEKWLSFFRQIMNFVPLLMIPFISLATKWFYKSKDLVYGEHLILNSYFFAHSYLILTLLAPFVIVIPSIASFFPLITVIVIIGYFSYALYSTFGGSPIRSILRALFTFIVGYLLFTISLVFIVMVVVIIALIVK